MHNVGSATMWNHRCRAARAPLCGLGSAGWGRQCACVVFGVGAWGGVPMVSIWRAGGGRGRSAGGVGDLRGDFSRLGVGFAAAFRGPAVAECDDAVNGAGRVGVLRAVVRAWVQRGQGAEGEQAARCRGGVAGVHRNGCMRRSSARERMAENACSLDRTGRSGTRRRLGCSLVWGLPSRAPSIRRR